MPDHAKKLGELAEILSGTASWLREAPIEADDDCDREGLHALAALLDALGPVVDELYAGIDHMRRVDGNYVVLQLEPDDALKLKAAVEELR